MLRMVVAARVFVQFFFDFFFLRNTWDMFLLMSSLCTGRFATHCFAVKYENARAVTTDPPMISVYLLLRILSDTVVKRCAMG